MTRVQVQFSLSFDLSFWKAQILRCEDGQLSLAEQIFAQEPSDAQLYAWAMACWKELRFLPLPGESMPEAHAGSVRQSRKTAARALRGNPITAQIRSAAQSARGQRRRTQLRAQRETLQMEEQRRRAQRKTKAKERKKGR